VRNDLRDIGLPPLLALLMNFSLLVEIQEISSQEGVMLRKFVGDWRDLSEQSTTFLNI